MAPFSNFSDRGNPAGLEWLVLSGIIKTLSDFAH
jgi:hypothetical protein